MIMKIKVEAFKIACDCCGEIFHSFDDFVCYDGDVDGSAMCNEADSAGWMVLGDKHYCPNCFSIDEENRIITKDGHKYDYDTSEEIKEE